jgi:plastocyanin
MRLRKLFNTENRLAMLYSRLIRLGHNLARGGTATEVALGPHPFATWITLACLAGICCGACGAAELSVNVVDRQGHAVGEVVVTAAPVGVVVHPAGNPASAIMDQVNRAFVPGVLVVAVGARVEFPNDDSVSHQVYSFSPAKRFQIPLYKGKPHEPALFDRPGLVVLGCNIHDQMVGYIYVTDAPYFGKTDGDGGLRFKDVADGDYQVTFWSPLIADAPESLTRKIHVDADGVTSTRLQLTRNLRTRPEPRLRQGDWEY